MFDASAFAGSNWRNLRAHINANTHSCNMDADRTCAFDRAKAIRLRGSLALCARVGQCSWAHFGARHLLCGVKYLWTGANRAERATTKQSERASLSQMSTATRRKRPNDNDNEDDDNGICKPSMHLRKSHKSVLARLTATACHLCDV